MFKDRDHAAELMSQELEQLNLKDPVLFAIPKGGVPIAFRLSRALKAPMELILVRKLSHPEDIELAIGAVSEAGDIILGTAIDTYGIPEEEAEDKAIDEIDRLRELRSRYSPGTTYPGLDLSERTAIIVDDGIATGATAVTAVKMLQRGPVTRIVVATPIISSSARFLLESEGAEVCALKSLEDFISISEFYENFGPVSEQQVIDLVARSKEHR